jgi:hypothetical protein
MVADMIITAISELLIDGELPSIKWFSSSDLRSMNSLEGVRKMEGLVRNKLRENRAGFENSGIVTEILKKLDQRGVLRI